MIVDSINASRYLLTLAVTVCVGIAGIGLAVCIIDPFGLSPLRVTLPHLNTIKLARNINDRLVKPYDAIRMQPRTVIVGTSRVKQAFNPALVRADYGPAYNAGIDALQMSEAMQLLAFYFRERLPIEHVWLELFPPQFGFMGWGEAKPIAGMNKLADMAVSTFSAFAIRASVATVREGMAGTDVAAQANGWRPIGDFGHAGPGFISPQWLEALGPPSVTPSFQKQTFSDLDDIVTICARHGVELKIFIGPIHPALAFIYLTANRNALRAWLSRVGAKHDVLSFLTTPDFVEHKLDDPKAYYVDSAHFSVPAANLLMHNLEGEPAKARMLNPATAELIFREWQAQLETWARLNPGYATTIRRIFGQGDTQPH